jgi:hypothetical protein
VRSDSQLLIYQLKGIYAVKAPRITPLYEKVTALIKQFKRIRFEWVPREENEEADELSRKGLLRLRFEELDDLPRKVQELLGDGEATRFLSPLGNLMPSLAFQEGGLKAHLRSPVKEELIGVTSPSF